MREAPGLRRALGPARHSGRTAFEVQDPYGLGDMSLFHMSLAIFHVPFTCL
jgi:hypothetical protein